VPADTTLWAQGDVPRELLFIKQGVVALAASDADGQETVTAIRGPKSLLGLEALRNQPAPASVQTLTDAVVCSATPELVKQRTGLLNSECTAAERAEQSRALLELTLDELLRVERDVGLRTGSALSRVARFLMVGGNLMESGRRAPFSKSRVAALLGLRPETMSRCLGELKSAGVITDDSRIHVNDAMALAELAG